MSAVSASQKAPQPHGDHRDFEREEECRKHAEHHQTCKDCADACAECRAEIAKLKL